MYEIEFRKACQKIKCRHKDLIGIIDRMFEFYPNDEAVIKLV